MADGGGDAGGAEEADAADAVLVEVRGGEVAEAGAVLEEHAGDEDFELDDEVGRDGAEEEDDLGELAAVGVVLDDAVVAAVVAPDRGDAGGVEDRTTFAEAGEDAVLAVGAGLED